MHHLRAALKAAINGPVTAVSGGVAEKIGAVGGSEKHAAAGVLHRSAAICGPVAILGLAQKLLGCFALAAAEGRHLAQLDDPDAPQVLAGLLAVEAGDAVVEPFPAHPAEQEALADALLAAEDADLVEFAAGPEAAGHRGHEHLPRHRASVAAVLCAQIVDEQRVQPLGSIPLQPGQVLPHRVFRMAAAGQGHSVGGLVDPAEVVDGLQIPADARVVLVAPVPLLLLVAPREGALAAQPLGKGVHPDAALERRVVFEDEPRVLNRAGDGTLLGTVELLLPLVGILGFGGDRLEALHGVIHGLLPEQRRRGAVGLGQRPHLLPAGQGSGGRSGGGVCVLLAEAVGVPGAASASCSPKRWMRTRSHALNSLPPAGSVA